MFEHPQSAHARTRREYGISLVEMVLTVAAIALLATVAGLAVSKTGQRSQQVKLASDVETVNSAIRIYLASGGNLDGIAAPEAVVAKLKTALTRADRDAHAGAPSGQMVDRRLAVRAVPADSPRGRAVYDTDSRRFVVVEGQAGVEFVLDADLAEAQPTIEDRSDGAAVSYARQSGWVWDHAATVNPAAPPGPSHVVTHASVTNTDPGAPVPPEPDPGKVEPPSPPPPPPPPSPPRLPRPNFSPSGGAHSEDEFPLEVAITNLPDPSVGAPFYRLDSGPWTPYEGPVSVAMNTRLRAEFLSLDSSAYRNSHERSAFYYPVPETLSGTVAAAFHSPAGGPNLDYEISNGGTRFTHGDPVYLLDGEPIVTGQPSILDFSAAAFENVPPGEPFKLGEFFYHNGNSYYDSHAEEVSLRLTISLPERGETVEFDLLLDLINTPNDDDPVSSADIVRLTNLDQHIPLQINGVSYRMRLQFGATDSFGFASQDQFHVFEGATGKGELLGTFLPN